MSVAVSTHTLNWSIYISTDHVWLFWGPQIHDTSNTTRSPFDLACNDKILFAYLFGTHNVDYD